jgi:three-Cys-motif partner protein
MKLPPTLVFADPFGFKGLSLQLIDAVTKDFGCDCIFFFNFNSINRWVATEVVRQPIGLLFGKEHAAELRASLLNLPSSKREAAILEELRTAIKDLGVKYVHPFSFKDEHSDRTSHHLILATKHPRGYELIKKITAKHSTESIQGVASFSYDPAPDAQARLDSP